MRSMICRKCGFIAAIDKRVQPHWCKDCLARAKKEYKVRQETIARLQKESGNAPLAEYVEDKLVVKALKKRDALTSQNKLFH